MKSVVHMLNCDEFARVRVGIGKPIENTGLIEHVIGAISEENRKLLEVGIEKAVEAVTEIMKNGIDMAMNKFN